MKKTINTHELRKENIGNEEIYQILKQQILDLELYPGQKISENEISNQYNISRTPVKTAFLRLMSEGFIEIRPQKGTYVALLDLDFIRDIIFSRCILEKEILMQAINSSTDSYIQALENNLILQKEVIEKDPVDTAEFFRLDGDFHRYSFEYTGHIGVWEMIQGFQLHYQRFRFLDVVTTKRFRELYDDHRALFESIQTGNADAIESKLKAHLNENLLRLADAIQTQYKDYFIQ